MVAALLKREGYDVVGVTLQLYDYGAATGHNSLLPIRAAIDEALAGHCDDIRVTIHPGETITVSDNGR